MATQERQWGVTAPISTAIPTAADRLMNDALVEELKRQNNYESPAETALRTAALAHLTKVVEEFVRHVLTKKGRFSQAAIKAAGGTLKTFGSYRLGVYSSGSDIDTLVIAPKSVNRDDFFAEFPIILRQMSPPDAIKELKPVPDASTPIIVLEYNGVDIDLGFASLPLESIPKDMDLKDNNLLKGLDEKALRAVGGPRQVEEILSLVPQEPVFKTALRAIKLWAKRRAVYANIVGFPGGIAWAIMVARVCQLYPAATASRVVSKFFHVMKIWPWPDPVQLKIPEDGPAGVQATVWNPRKNPRDKRHMMPVITPAFPSMCSTHNINQSTKHVILTELLHANSICDEIANGKKQWKDLFSKHTFFTKDYTQYLSINSTSRSSNSQQLWSGTVESKLRLLVLELEKEGCGVRIAHPYVKGFERVHRAANENQVTEILEQNSLAYQVKEIETKTTDDTNDPMHKAAADAADVEVTMDKVKPEASEDVKNITTGEIELYSTTYYIGLELDPEQRSFNISWPCQRFQDICTSWPNYDKETNYVSVHATRAYTLPDDVFQPGENKPIKPKKKGNRKANGEGADSAKKRKIAQDTSLVDATFSLDALAPIFPTPARASSFFDKLWATHAKPVLATRSPRRTGLKANATARKPQLRPNSKPKPSNTSFKPSSQPKSPRGIDPRARAAAVAARNQNLVPQAPLIRSIKVESLLVRSVEIKSKTPAAAPKLKPSTTSTAPSQADSPRLARSIAHAVARRAKPQTGPSKLKSGPKEEDTKATFFGQNISKALGVAAGRAPSEKESPRASTRSQSRRLAAREEIRKWKRSAKFNSSGETGKKRLRSHTGERSLAYRVERQQAAALTAGYPGTSIPGISKKLQVKITANRKRQSALSEEYLASLHRQSYYGPESVFSIPPSLLTDDRRWFLIHQRDPQPSRESQAAEYGEKMKASVEIVSTPTADTRGTCLILDYSNKSYVIGHAHEGCQRAFIARGKKLNKITEVFLAGKVRWKNVGGLLGLIMTTADSRTSAKNATDEALKAWARTRTEQLDKILEELPDGSAAKKRALEDKANVKAKQANVPETNDQRFGIHGGPNLTYTVATARRFIFRKGLPLSIHETAQGAYTEHWLPTWKDDNVQVWSMPVSPASPGSKTRKRSYDDHLGQEHDTLARNAVKDHDIVRAVVGEMFDSDWKLDGLVATKLQDVKMPAEIFTAVVGEGLKPYKGPQPGEVPHHDLPDIEVFVRRPWPAATVGKLPAVQPSDTCMSYILKGHRQRGTFLPEKARNLGVRMKQYSILTKGESITTEAGRVVKPEDVMGPGKVGSGFAFIEIPSQKYVEPTIRREEWTAQSVMEGVETIFWALGPGISENQSYQNFVQDHQHLKHVVISPDHTPNYIAFDGSATLTVRLASIDPLRFPAPGYSNVPAKPLPSALSQADIAHPGQVLLLAPQSKWYPELKMPLFDALGALQDIPPAVTEARDRAWADIRASSVQNQIDTQSLPGLDNEIITLGTGSSAPSKYRNVSATLLRIPGRGSYLFDAGENTLGQLARLYTESQLQEVLKDLKMIWVSHLHADHHLGLASVIKAWHEVKYGSQCRQPASRPSGDPALDYLGSKGLTVISSEAMLDWLFEYSCVEDIGLENVALLRAIPFGPSTVFDFGAGQKTLDVKRPEHKTALRNLTGFEELNAVYVKHCHDAAAVSLTFPDGFKISYSGDCRPSERFAVKGADSTVLIHEATFGDAMIGDAKAKKHSTASEAIGVGVAMRAPRVLLTHFSQRYAKMPDLSKAKQAKVNFADSAESKSFDDGVLVNSDDTADEIDNAENERPEVEEVSRNQDMDSVASELDKVSEKVAKDVKQGGFQGIKVGIAFDNMRVKVRDLAVLEKFTDVFEKLLEENPNDKKLSSSKRIEENEKRNKFVSDTLKQNTPGLKPGSRKERKASRKHAEQGKGEEKNSERDVM